MSRDADREVFGEEDLRELRELSFVPPEYADANWARDPWFCREENDWLSEVGFPRERCLELVGPLRQVFPPEVCRRILRQPMDAPLLFGLYQGMPGFLIPLLDVAVSVAAVGRLEGDPLLKRLRRRGSFASASSELALWADLVRAHLAVRREPGVLVGTSTRYPDFGVQVGAEYFYIEATQLEQSALQRAAHLIAEEVGRLRPFLLDDREVRLWSDEEFAEGLGAEVQKRLEPGDLLSEYRTRQFIASEVLPHVQRALEQVRDSGATPGRYAIPKVGYFEISLSTEAAAEIHILEDQDGDDPAVRVWRKVLDEALQLPPGSARVARGIVAVDLGSAALIPSVAEALRTKISSGSPDVAQKLSGLDAIVLRGRSPVYGGSRERSARLVLCSGAIPTVEWTQLAQAAGPGTVKQLRR